MRRGIADRVMEFADEHPRVFIPLSPSKPQHSCPYCGATYVLEGEEGEAQPAEKGT